MCFLAKCWLPKVILVDDDSRPEPGKFFERLGLKQIPDLGMYVFLKNNMPFSHCQKTFPDSVDLRGIGNDSKVN